MEELRIVGYVICGILALILLLFFVTTVYKWRVVDEVFRIPSEHASETAPLAAIIGWCALAQSIFLIRSIALTDAEALLTYTTTLFQVSLFILVATKIPKKFTLSILVPSLLAIITLCYGLFQHSDFSSISNAMYVILLLVAAAGAFVALVALHWKTREKLIVKVTKAEKQIKKAKKWFLFGANEV
ncbi:hypothetical protein TeGR_g11713 [Tetraparma gracilis]|uniref:Uncharacterized protein n=1 Tax=Tetraparma gracilis TaxID=2962635 RepID=A0ABQ6MIA1_9STRA|nr:hypothetical protein TeGR_g11713 [Tetraparma gracilis]